MLDKVLKASGEDDTFNRALCYLMRCPRSEVELRRYLFRRKDANGPSIYAAIERLRELGYINDAAYAQMFVAAKSVNNSTRAIELKLRTRGVDKEIIKTATEAVGDQSELAKHIAEKYMRNKPRDRTTVSKLFRHLVGKGFEYDDAQQITRGYTNEIGD